MFGKPNQTLTTLARTDGAARTARRVTRRRHNYCQTDTTPRGAPPLARRIRRPRLSQPWATAPPPPRPGLARAREPRQMAGDARRRRSPRRRQPPLRHHCATVGAASAPPPPAVRARATAPRAARSSTRPVVDPPGRRPARSSTRPPRSPSLPAARDCPAPRAAWRSRAGRRARTRARGRGPTSVAARRCRAWRWWLPFRPPLPGR